MSKFIDAVGGQILFNEATNRVDLSFDEKSGNREDFSLPPFAAAMLVSKVALALLGRPEPEIQSRLQQFCVTDLRARAYGDHLTLEYQMVNGMDFRSEFSREALEALHRERGEMLGLDEARH